MLPMFAWIIAVPLLGFLTGLRSMTPMAVLCWFAYAGHLLVRDTWAGWSASLISAAVFSVLALGEFIGDKLPSCPNRIAVFPLMARVVFGGLVGALAATGLHGSALEGILLGSCSAVGGAFLGYFVRRTLVQEKGFSDFFVALAEDISTVSLAILAMGIVTG